MKHYLYLTLTILLLAGCSQKPQSDVDTPEYHYKAGMRAVETDEYSAALTSFQRSVDLDKKFALGYCGLGLAHAHLGNVKEAKKNVDKGVSNGKKDPDVLALGARVWITLREHEKKWFKRASKLLDKALKRKKNHETSQYYYGVAHLYNYEFEEAGLIPYYGAIWDVNPALNTEGVYPLLHEKGGIGVFAKGLFGWNGNPSAIEVMSYLLTLGLISFVWTKASESPGGAVENEKSPMNEKCPTCFEEVQPSKQTKCSNCDTELNLQ